MRGRVPAVGTPAARRPVTRGVRGLDLEAPAWLEPEAAEIFTEAAADLAGTGAVRSPDRHGLALWASLMVTASRAMRAYADHPDPASVEAKRLQVVALGATDRAARLAAEYGLTPVSRVRLGVTTLEGMRLLDHLETDPHTTHPN